MLVLPTLGFAVISKHNTNINHVHAVCRFINYLISKCVSSHSTASAGDIWLQPATSCIRERTFLFNTLISL
ncbi:hypothetical protein CEO49_03135 [Klebsiella variicola]|nr:hypothetical protein CEO49_03135 [Klebsiella variicola]